MSEIPDNPEHQSSPLSREIADMLAEHFGEAHGFDDETVAEIASLPFEEAFAMAYNYLAQIDADADDILAPWMESPAD